MYTENMHIIYYSLILCNVALTLNRSPAIAASLSRIGLMTPAVTRSVQIWGNSSRASLRRSSVPNDETSQLTSTWPAYKQKNGRSLLSTVPIWLEGKLVSTLGRLLRVRSEYLKEYVLSRSDRILMYYIIIVMPPPPSVREDEGNVFLSIIILWRASRFNM